MHKELRLKKRHDFRKIYNFGNSTANKELVIYVLNNPQIENYRFGISVSKKIGNAVIRNRIKRLIKEALRSILQKVELKKNKDIIIIARKPAAEMSFAEIEKSLMYLLKKRNLLN